ncbi:MAG: MMPL family transporter [Lachnospiraceae bacterium]|jgi:predicted RND superfamily exporter protein
MENEQNEKKGGNQAMVKICGFIVDKRNLFFLLFGILIIFSAVSRNWVNVENSMSHYLPDSTETKQGLDLMEQEFITYGTCDVMVANVSYEQAESIERDLEFIPGVFMIDFDDTEDHYFNGSSYYNVTFDYDEKDDQCLEVLERVKEELAGYDYYLSTTLGDIEAELIAEEMNVIVVLVAFVVVTVLLLTSQAYAEVPVLLITFVAAAILQMGTNFVFGTISFVSNSVTVVLQLALSVDYAIILLNRYKEEHAALEAREAIIIALSKAIPEICGSSLTTIGGLIAMGFMQYKMGPDLSVCLIKSIFLALGSVFLLMPGVIMLFSKLMDTTKHKNFIPDIPFVGKFDYATRHIVAPLFVLVIVGAYTVSSKCPYVFGDSTITPPIQNSIQKTEELQTDNFGTSNMVALIVPAGDYEKEAKLLEELEACPEVDYTQGLANIEALDDYCLTDKLTPRQFSELIDLDYEVAELVYAAYAVNDEDYAKVVNGLPEYKVSLIDMFMFVHDEVEEGYVTLEDDMQDTLDDAFDAMNFAKNQLQGENYSRMLVFLTLPEESEETFAFLDRMHEIAEKYYPGGRILVCGESVSQYDLQKTFGRDNLVNNVISILAVLVVLLFTFKSAGMPVLLIAVIQGCIWLNFSIPALQHDNIFFMSYLIVSSIQMGANIDYAIVIAGRYMELRKENGRRQSIIDSMNQAFPTIITSGTMMVVAGFLIGKLTSNAAIFGIGKCLGRGTTISILVTMFVLPQILLVGDKIIEKTAFVMNMPIRTKNVTGLMRVDGLVRGRIEGTVTGTMSAIVRGNVSAYVEAGDVTELTEEEYRQLTETVSEEMASRQQPEIGVRDTSDSEVTGQDKSREVADHE